MLIRDANPTDDAYIATSFRQMWLDNGIPAADIVSDHDERTRAFLRDGRDRLALVAKVAEAEDGRSIGCAIAQRFAGLYPNVLQPSLRDYGYLWGVFVDAAHRQQGLGARLTQSCVDTLKRQGCTHVVLHAAPMGKRIYERLGFTPSNEMRLDLRE